jgi:acyl-CoA reductase-like NAD-dependent aldehyde dehydrogenase
LDVVNPATGAMIANVPSADKADVDRAVAAARRAFDDGMWAKVSPSEKSRMMWKISDLIERDLEELAELEWMAAGCTIVLKAAEQTPMTALRLAELIQEAGIPAGVVNILTGFGETAGAALAAHPGVDKVAFTGSTEVGKLIVKAAASDLKKVSLELGGKSPAIILPDADLDLAIAGAANAIFFNHGQCCCAGSRLFAHKKVYDKVVAGVADIAGKIKVGPGLDPTTEMGPLVSSGSSTVSPATSSRAGSRALELRSAGTGSAIGDISLLRQCSRTQNQI